MLADLMHDSYQGTIDYDGETIKEALNEVEGYFSRKDSTAMLSCSTIAVSGGRVVSACLMSKWEKREEPLVAYIMTGTKFKKMGLATNLTASTIRKIRKAGYGGVRAVVTEGNTPSERMMLSLGFERLT